MEFIHTWHWSLDELYYAAILSPLVWLALMKDKLMLAGFLAAYMVFNRFSYAYAVFAIGFWWILRERRRVQEYLWIVAGAMVFYLASSGSEHLRHIRRQTVVVMI